MKIVHTISNLNLTNPTYLDYSFVKRARTRIHSLPVLFVFFMLLLLLVLAYHSAKSYYFERV